MPLRAPRCVRSRGLFLPLRAMSTRRFPRVLFQRRLENTHSTGMTGPCHIHHNPSPHPSQADDRSAYRCMLLQPSPLESVAPALGIHAFTSPRLTSKDFFARDFLAGVTYIREQCCFCVGRSPRIWSNLRFAPMRMDPRLRLVIVI